MQAQQKRVNDIASKNIQSRAHKRATTLFAAETEKPEDERKLLASKVSELVYRELECIFKTEKSSMKWQQVELVFLR